MSSYITADVSVMKLGRAVKLYYQQTFLLSWGSQSEFIHHTIPCMWKREEWSGLGMSDISLLRGTQLFKPAVLFLLLPAVLSASSGLCPGGVVSLSLKILRSMHVSN